MTGYVRKIGTCLCVTFPNGNFTMLAPAEFSMLPDSIHETIQRNGYYKGSIPDSLYLAYLACESQSKGG